MLHQHVEALEELEDDILYEWILDIRAASWTIKRATGAERVNVAILGNAEPHLHAHLIPRVVEGDPAPNQSPWDNPNPARPLAVFDRTAIVERLKEILVELKAGSSSGVKPPVFRPTSRVVNHNGESATELR